MMITHRFLPTVGLTIALAGCRSEPTIVRIDGSAGVAPLVRALARGFDSTGGASIQVGSGLGSRARLDSVQQGAIDVAMASHGLDSADLAARGLVAHEIARTAVVFAVNSSVDVTSMRVEEICDVYSGRKPAWQLFGGTPGPIVPLMRPPDEVDAEVAIEAIPCLRDLQFGGSVVVHDQADAMAAAIAATPGALGLTSMPYVQQSDGAMRAIAIDSVMPATALVMAGTYPMVRRAFLVTRASAAPAVQEFLAFVAGREGDRIIRDNGAIPPP